MPLTRAKEMRKIERRGGASPAHVAGDEHQQAGDGRGDPRRRDRSAPLRVVALELDRQGAVAGHDLGDAGGGEEVGDESREHGQQTGDHDQPEAHRAEEGMGGAGDHRVRVEGHEVRQPGAGGSAGHGDERQQRQVDEHGDPQGEEHGARQVPPRLLHLTGHGRNQIKALQGDEGVSHGGKQSPRALR